MSTKQQLQESNDKLYSTLSKRATRVVILERLLDAALALNEIVEGVGCKRWACDNQRLKDTEEWACFYVRLKEAKP